MSNKDKYRDIEKCFDDEGNIKFDPYRNGEDMETYELYDILFDDRGYLRDYRELGNVIKKNNWAWDSTAVGLYHAYIFSSNTKGSYPTIYYFR